MLSLLLNVFLAMSLSPAPVDPHVEQVARVLAPLADLRSLSTRGPASWCPGEKEELLWLAIEQENKPRLDCFLKPGIAPRCSANTRPLQRRDTPNCSPGNGSTTPAPDWVLRLAPLLLDEEEPIAIEPVRGAPSLHLETGSFDHYVMLRAVTGWLLLRQSIGLSDLDDRRNQLRIIETSQLTKSPSWGVVAAFYDGGTEQGEADTELYIVVPDKDSLRVLARRTIGVFRWVASDAQPRRSAARIARSEVAVTLKPTFTPSGFLQLRLAEKSLGQLSRFCSQEELASNRALESEICPLPLITQVRDAQGTWQLAGDTWVRVPAAVPRRLSSGPGP